MYVEVYINSCSAGTGWIRLMVVLFETTLPEMKMIDRICECMDDTVRVCHSEREREREKERERERVC
jgi:hypothetical protein